MNRVLYDAANARFFRGAAEWRIALRDEDLAAMKGWDAYVGVADEQCERARTSIRGVHRKDGAA